MHVTTRTPRHRWSVMAGLSALAAAAVLAMTLAIPAIAQDRDEPAERGDPGQRHDTDQRHDPGERHAEMLAELEELDGDADAIAAALAELHEERMAERAERQEARQQARDARHPERAERGDADGTPRHGATEGRRGPEGDGRRRQHEHLDQRPGPGPRNGAGEDCPLTTS